MVVDFAIYPHYLVALFYRLSSIKIHWSVYYMMPSFRPLVVQLANNSEWEDKVCTQEAESQLCICLGVKPPGSTGKEMNVMQSEES
jgi:hypothetical protein